MSLLIKNMEMPTVRDTLVLVKPNGTAIVYEDEAYVTAAVPVPTPHGTLIDRDRLKADNPRHMSADVPYVTEVTVEEIIDAAPTVIEAEQVYNKYTDTAGNLHWTGTKSGEHTIRAEEDEI